MKLSTETQRKLFHEKLDKWLDEERFSEYGGWATCTKKDLEELYDILYFGLLPMKFQVDPDGDLPVQINIVNRTTHQMDSWLPMLYWSREPNEEEALERFDIAYINHGIAAGQLGAAWKMFQHFRAKEREKNES